MDSLYVSINHYPQHVLCIYIISNLHAFVLFFFLKKQDVCFRKSCVDFNFISHVHSYVYIHIALCYQELYFQDSCNNLAMPESI